MWRGDRSGTVRPVRRLRVWYSRTSEAIRSFLLLSPPLPPSPPLHSLQLHSLHSSGILALEHSPRDHSNITSRNAPPFHLTSVYNYVAAVLDERPRPPKTSMSFIHLRRYLTSEDIPTSASGSIITPILKVLQDPASLLSSAFVLDENTKRHQLASARFKNVHPPPMFTISAMGFSD